MSETFNMDGTEHTKGSECLCNPTKCLIDSCPGYVHYQGIYGGAYYECDTCGWAEAWEQKVVLEAQRKVNE